jgi:hypothetical protein
MARNHIEQCAYGSPMSLAPTETPRSFDFPKSLIHGILDVWIGCNGAQFAVKLVAI